MLLETNMQMRDRLLHYARSNCRTEEVVMVRKVVAVGQASLYCFA